MVTNILRYLACINIFAVLIMAYDKRSARKDRERVPEKVLFLTAALGGSPGIWAGMYLFRHKTKHRSFVIGIPAILILQIALIIYLLVKQPFTLPL